MSRINDHPFPENAEELRLLVIEIIQMILISSQRFLSVGNGGNDSQQQEVSHLYSSILLALIQALADAFPAVKRASAEAISSIAKVHPYSIRLHGKAIIKALIMNTSHNHAKSRVITLNAIVNTLCCLTPGTYQSLMKESLLTVFQKAVLDRTATVRVDLSLTLARLIDFRIGQCSLLSRPLDAVDLEALVLLLLLSGEDTEGVQTTAKKSLIEAVRTYNPTTIPSTIASDIMDEDIIDGEVSLKTIEPQTTAVEDATTQQESSLEKLRFVLTSYLSTFVDLLLTGTENWSSETKLKYIFGLKSYLSYVQELGQPALPILLPALAIHIRDEESEVRQAAEGCVFEIGKYTPAAAWLAVILPHVLGQLSSSDSAPQRAGAVRVLTNLWKGRSVHFHDHVTTETSQEEERSSAVKSISSALVSPGLLVSYRDSLLREALLLLVRTLLDTLSSDFLVKEEVIQRRLCLCLLYLAGRGQSQEGEGEIISSLAVNELGRLSTNSHVIPLERDGKTAGEEYLLAKHFYYCYDYIVRGQENWPMLDDEMSVKTLEDIVNSEDFHPHWEVSSANRIAFVELIRLCPTLGWKYHKVLLPLFQKHCQPQPGPATGSMEANMATYASQRGEEVIAPNRGDLDVRLGLLASLEGFLRAGTSHWQCGSSLAAAAYPIMHTVLLPNLIWRIGRVEATIRKVALAASFALLKGGAIPFETLFKIASDLVPLLVSNLDDMETSPRLMAALSLTVIFDRLKGVFSDQSIQEIYPKLIARLDDSSDEVRAAICQTLTAFFKAGATKTCYHATMVDYVLDQLFIHLDDIQQNIQQAVCEVILCIGREIDEGKVIQKAELQRTSHRSPKYCDLILREVANRAS
eukprot:scaffold146_cov171-Ochromonas_danica.AAC.23